MCAIFNFVAAEEGATNAVAINAPVAIAASTFFKVVPLLLSNNRNNLWFCQSN